MTTTYTIPATGTTTTAWYGFCGDCGLYWNNHKIGCPKLAMAAWPFSAHRADCRRTTCRPDLHLTHPDTLACERSGCRPADPS